MCIYIYAEHSHLDFSASGGWRPLQGRICVESYINYGWMDGYVCICMHLYVYMYVCMFVYDLRFIRRQAGGERPLQGAAAAPRPPALAPPLRAAAAPQASPPLPPQTHTHKPYLHLPTLSISFLCICVRLPWPRPIAALQARPPLSLPPSFTPLPSHSRVLRVTVRVSAMLRRAVVFIVSASVLANTHTHTHTCTCVCACVCARARVRVRACTCLCACACVRACRHQCWL
jgi:hypothetical protein